MTRAAEAQPPRNHSRAPVARSKQEKKRMDKLISALVIVGAAVTLWAVLLLGPPEVVAVFGVVALAVLVVMLIERE